MDMELTEEERALIDKAEVYNIRTSTLTQQKESKPPMYARPLFWGSLLMIIPTIVTIIILGTINQANTLINSELGVLLSSSGNDAENLISPENMEWMNSVTPLYEGRYIILGGIWTVSIIVFLLFFLWDYYIMKKRKKVEEKSPPLLFSNLISFSEVVKTGNNDKSTVKNLGENDGNN